MFKKQAILLLIAIHYNYSFSSELRFAICQNKKYQEEAAKDPHHKIKLMMKNNQPVHDIIELAKKSGGIDSCGGSNCEAIANKTPFQRSEKLPDIYHTIPLLSLAIAYRRNDVVKALLEEEKANPNIVSDRYYYDEDPDTRLLAYCNRPIAMAIEKNNFAAVQMLLAHGVDLQDLSNSSMPTLFDSILDTYYVLNLFEYPLAGIINITKLLLENEMPLSRVTNTKETIPPALIALLPK